MSDDTSKKPPDKPPAKPAVAVDRLVDQLRSEGEILGPGEFTMDAAVAREKMRQFQLADPWSYPLELVKAAVLGGATGIHLEVERKRLRMRWDGAPLSADDLRGLWGSMFSGATDADMQARRQLALGLNAAQALTPDLIRLRSGNGEQDAVFVLEEGEETERIDVQPRTEDHKDGETQASTHLEVRYGSLPDGLPHATSRRQGAAHTRALIRERCQHASTAVYLNDERVDGGLCPTDAVASVDLDGKHLRGTLSCTPGLAPGEVRFVIHGVWSASVTPKKLPAGFVAVVADPRFSMDLTHGAIIQDAPYHEALAAVKPNVDRLSRLLRYGRVSLSCYSKDDGMTTESVGGSSLSTSRSSQPPLYLTVESAGATRLFGHVKTAIRVVTWVLCLGPLLLVPKIILWAMDIRAGDWITVAFVGLVVLFFLLLVALVALYAFVGPRSRREQHLTLQLQHDRLDDALGLLHKRDPGVMDGDILVRLLKKRTADYPVHIRGRVARLEPTVKTEQAVLLDTWWSEEGDALRLQAGDGFAVLSDGPPVVVQPEEDVWLMAPYQPAAAPPGLHPALAKQLSQWLKKKEWLKVTLAELMSKGHGARLEVGDEVEIVAAEGASTLKDVDALPGSNPPLAVPRERGANPYRRRGKRQGLGLKDGHGAPLIIQLIRRRGESSSG